MGIQHTNLSDNSSSELTRLNLDELKKQFGAVYSRQNAAVNMRSVSADTTLTYKDSMVFVDTSGGNVTITLAAANSWGTNKSPKISIIKTSASNTLTVAAGSGDTLNYWSNGASIITGNITTAGVLDLVADGSTKWFALSGIGAALVPKYALLIKTVAQTGLTAETTLTWGATALSGFSIASDVLTVAAGAGGLYKVEVAVPFYMTTANGEGFFGYKINGGTTLVPLAKEPYAVGAYDMLAGTFYMGLSAGDTVEYNISEGSAGNISVPVGATVTLTQIV